ncbi:class I SAM-dependent methyltransferase [Enterococcus ureasiticus]|nr:class I SAM-dependent methyltransferase [Enterococcus ureasiticus]
MEMAKKTFKNEIIDYWSERSETYGQQHHEELLGEQKSLWQNVIVNALTANEQPVQKILDIGTGPGFLSILLAEKGFEVTSIDMTEEMLIQAKLNAGDLAEKIEWKLMDAHNLTFDTADFDAIVTRNVTWNLEEPKEAYKEWYRVLKPGGILLNFDSNWYKYLYDETLREKYEKNRELTQEMAIKDYYVGTNIDWMENLAKEMPLSKITRPNWDKKVLKECGFQTIAIHENMNDQLLSDIQKINFSFSPIFLIQAVK